MRKCHYKLLIILDDVLNEADGVQQQLQAAVDLYEMNDMREQFYDSSSPAMTVASPLVVSYICFPLPINAGEFGQGDINFMLSLFVSVWFCHVLV